MPTKTRTPVSHTQVPHTLYGQPLTTIAKQHGITITQLINRIMEGVPEAQWLDPELPTSGPRCYLINGHYGTLSAHAKRAGIPLITIRRRRDLGWPQSTWADPPELTIKSPPKSRKTRRKTPVFAYERRVKLGTETRSAREWMREKNLSEGQIRYRLQKGMSLKEILSSHT